jgi:beta-aspartyl-peptidase (threonine type)
MNLRGVSVAVTLLALSAVIAAVEPANTGDSRHAVRKVLDDQVAAWNKGDLEGFMATYWNSDELTFYSTKDVTRGWKATLERYRKRYQGEGREMGQLTFTDIEIEMLGPDAAAARGRWKVVTNKETLQGLFSLILRKKPEGWRITHDHTS